MTDATTTLKNNMNKSDTKKLAEVAKTTKNNALLRQICNAFGGTQSPSLKLLLDRIHRNEWLCYGDMLTLSSTLWRIKVEAGGDAGPVTRKDLERIVMEKKLQRRKNLLKTKWKEKVVTGITVLRMTKKVCNPVILRYKTTLRFVSRFFTSWSCAISAKIRYTLFL